MNRVIKIGRSGSFRINRRNAVLVLASLVSVVLLLNHFGLDFGFVIAVVVAAGITAYTIHKRALEQNTRQITEASRMHLATVEALATAIDARDQIGMGHVRRTQIYAVGLGNVLGLEEGEIDALRTGALLHDIGKLAVPDHILNKPGQLTSAEMEKTKIHSSVGASILEKVGFPYPVVPTVKHHHEFWDGNGYPEGLKGSNIPLTARILSIADAYDALRVARPYRPARSRDDAIEFLRERSGSQYDPKLVDVFIRNLPRFEYEIATNGLDYQRDQRDIGVHLHDLEESRSPNYVEQIKQANREVFTLYSLAREFSSSLDLDEILVLFADKVAEFVPYDSIVVSLLDEKNSSAKSIYAGGKNNGILANRVVTVGQGATGYVLKKQKPVVNVDPALDFSFESDDLVAEYRAMAALPLIADDRTIGAVSLYSCSMPCFQDEHIRLLETISHIAGDAISVALQHAEAEAHALTDPMTGLPNSRSLRSQFEKEVTRASRSSKRFQLLVMDLDGFKAVNDTYGHKIGDTMLRAIGGVINSQLREYDFLARYGGDEFVAIIPETDTEDTDGLHQRIADAVASFKLEVNPDSVANVGISLGSSSYPVNGESLDALIEAADKAMYLAKNGNRQRRSHRSEIEPEVDRAGTHNEVPQADYPKDLPQSPTILVDDQQMLESSAIN